MVAVPLPLDRIALTLGITGHRDISPHAVGAVRSAFAKILTDLGAEHPHTPIVVLSALASGADTLAAQVARSLGVAVVACLPVAPEIYQHDFATPEDRALLFEALKTCARVTVVGTSDDRHVRYVETGVYVAQYSEILIAFWDGEGARGKGGTAEIVAARLAGDTGDETALETVGRLDAGPVYHVFTPRSDTKHAEDAGSVVKRFPDRYPSDATFRDDFAGALKEVDRYNADVAGVRDASGETDGIAALCERTSNVARNLQITTYRYLYVLYAIAILATAAQYSPDPIVKYAMFPIAFAAYRLAKRYDYETRYQDYRALAESLRVQRFWFDAGVPDERADRCYLGTQEPDLRWIRIASRYAYFAFRANTEVADLAGAMAWIDRQRTYFVERAHGDKSFLDRLNFIKSAMFWVAAVVSIILIVFLYVPMAPQYFAGRFAPFPALASWLEGVQTAWNASAFLTTGWFAHLRSWDAGTGTGTSVHHAWLVRLSTGVLALYAATAVLVQNYADKRGFAVNVRRYDRMFVVFDRAKQQLASMRDPTAPRGRQIVRQLGRDSLVESAEWLLGRRDHPMDYIPGSNPKSTIPGLVTIRK